MAAFRFALQTSSAVSLPAWRDLVLKAGDPECSTLSVADQVIAELAGS